MPFGIVGVDLGPRRSVWSLTAARKRIRGRETEVAVTKRANELLQAQSDPRGAEAPSRES
jgi:hypothetical protein